MAVTVPSSLIGTRSGPEKSLAPRWRSAAHKASTTMRLFRVAAAAGSRAGAAAAARSSLGLGAQSLRPREPCSVTTTSIGMSCGCGWMVAIAAWA